MAASCGKATGGRGQQLDKQHGAHSPLCAGWRCPEMSRASSLTGTDQSPTP